MKSKSTLHNNSCFPRLRQENPNKGVIPDGVHKVHEYNINEGVTNEGGEAEKQKNSQKQEAHMNSIADGTVIIQTSSESVPSTPS